MKKLLLGVGLVSVILTAGCDQYAAKHTGGSYTVELEEGEKLQNVTWKEDSLWILTKPMKQDDVAETYKFKEDSTLGIVEGTVTIVEKK